MNIARMMQQVRDMQSTMLDLDNELENEEVEGASGGGMVKAVMTGKFELKRLSIDPSLVVPDETGVLEDLVVAAVGDAHVKARNVVKEKTSRLTDGFELPPGLNLPM